MKSVRCLAYCRNEESQFERTQKSILQWSGKKTPLTAPSGGKLDEHTQAVEEEGCHGDSSYSR